MFTLLSISGIYFKVSSLKKKGESPQLYETYALTGLGVKWKLQSASSSGRVNPSFPEFLCVQDFLPLQSFAALKTQCNCNTIHKAILL